ESLPSAGYDGSSYTTVGGQNQYVRKHNPWVNWQDSATDGVPSANKMPFTSFPSSANYPNLPTVSIVLPNQQKAMHDSPIAQGDTWLNSNISDYATWAKTHNSLLVITWDEDDNGPNNQIPTIFYGQNVLTGQYGETINHYSVLRTLEDM